MNLKQFTIHVLTLACICGLAANAFSADIPEPEIFFGHKPGEDYKLIRWEKIYEYFQLLAAESSRIQVEELGKTTLGNSFILAIISSPENISMLINTRKSQGNSPKEKFPKKKPADWLNKGKLSR